MRTLLAVLLAATLGCTSAQDRVSPDSTRAVAKEGLEHGAGEEAVAHLLVLLTVSRSGLEVSQARVVRGPRPVLRGSAPVRPWRLELLNAEGEVLHGEPLPAASVLRSEALPGEDGPPAVVTEASAFTARLPLLPHARQLRLWGQAFTLPAQDRRAAGLAPDEWVELGRTELPEVER